MSLCNDHLLTSVNDACVRCASNPSAAALNCAFTPALSASPEWPPYYYYYYYNYYYYYYYYYHYYYYYYFFFYYSYYYYYYYHST